MWFSMATSSRVAFLSCTAASSRFRRASSASTPFLKAFTTGVTQQRKRKLRMEKILQLMMIWQILSHDFHSFRMILDKWCKICPQYNIIWLTYIIYAYIYICIYNITWLTRFVHHPNLIWYNGWTSSSPGWLTSSQEAPKSPMAPFVRLLSLA